MMIPRNLAGEIQFLINGGFSILLIIVCNIIVSIYYVLGSVFLSISCIHTRVSYRILV